MGKAVGHYNVTLSQYKTETYFADSLNKICRSVTVLRKVVPSVKAVATLASDIWHCLACVCLCLLNRLQISHCLYISKPDLVHQVTEELLLVILC